MSQQPPQTAQPNSAASYLDLGITLAINSWPALSLAVESNWGGPTSSDKRDWLCGAISDMLNDRPETDAEDLEDVLIQVMNDEFDVVVDDESAAPVAAEIIEMRGLVAKGEFGPIQQMWENWQAKSQQRAGNAAAAFKRVEDEEQDSEDNEDLEEDVDMGDAPALVRVPKEKVEPEIDDDGFTKVVGKRR
ncbi:Pre-rRNA-processing protein TSR2-domain-containing protein [Aspergillus alliaceus]|uniref:Pre-rRNA-processing protein TSR2-domain-containing protein n=1 Tax=Petromyces alliaceus TaxID=209559 RepID=A0A5N6G107_PETAA|nr:Pre-rRNA-processing protein TSR2-domain-containing protein [Aspergillus alliaceus]KAB8235219.1 Pre-rRNA-processing protein TSR2-domain-containing protein [Aspergillus alliaceus]KAE8388115.1 Pre-rRNA-processing protein TSR2-domain-containing protein [Aspergillus alliaceus]